MGVLTVRKLIALVFNYSLDGLLAGRKVVFSGRATTARRHR
jgi:hypothetical protein